jgi:uncharacterized protein (TIGR03437 family)
MRRLAKSIIHYALLGLLACAAPALAQTGMFNSVRVGPVSNGLHPHGAVFYVDGVPYTSAQVFNWQVGDVHTIRIYLPALTNNPFVPINQGHPFQVVSDVGLGMAYFAEGPPAGLEFDSLPPSSTPSENQCYESDPMSSTPAPVTCIQPLGGAERLVRIRVWPGLRTVSWNVQRYYRFRINTHNEGCAPLYNPGNQTPLTGACGPIPGYIDITSAATGEVVNRVSTGDFWVREGTIARFLAVPTVGYAFRNWITQPGIDVQINGAGYGFAEFFVNNPFHMHAYFGPGKFYVLRTEPEGLEVVVDRAVIRTKDPEPMVQSLCDAYLTAGIQVGQDSQGVPVGQGGDNMGDGLYCTVWPFDSTRILAARENQTVGSKIWAFDSIINTGGGQNSEFTVSGENLATNVITWKFVPTAAVSITTQPVVNLPVVVNNRTWPSYFFHFGLNKEFTIDAPLETVDGNGQRWRFQGWSNGGPARQTLTVTQEMVADGLRLLAFYVPMNKVSVQTNPPGLPVLINGQECPHPCLVERLAEESVTVSVLPSIVEKNVLRYDFDGWADGGGTTRTVNFMQSSQRLVANYRLNYRLTALTNPANGADFTFEPASSDGFFPVNTRVNITAAARRGFRFGFWTGDAAGRTPSTNLIVNGPRTAIAEMAVVPFLDPAGVKNAAGTGPQDMDEIGRVAPGSLISILGANMTDRDETGPRSPQAQSLAGIVVRVNNRMLPLSFASPGYVNAQLPFDLPEGRHRLTVTRLGQEDLTADFIAVRNAPGLFGVGETATEDLPPLAWALKANGTAISEENPARANETIDLMATGVGPYRNNPPIGFAIPTGARFVQADTVEVLAGDEVVQPVEAIAAPGFVGTTAVRVRLGAQFPTGQNVTVRIRVNGKESNPVRLFVQP